MMKGNKMSNIFNEMILENLFDESVEAGFSDAEAEEMANEKIETLGSQVG